MRDSSTVNFARILLSAALLLPLFAQAQEERLYRVELMVFSQAAGGAAEQWEAVPDLEYPNQYRFLTFPGEQPAAAPQEASFVTLPSEQRELSGEAANMQSSGRYRILFHEAWMQPLTGESEAVPIVLDRSGDGGKWPALQGSVKLYQSNNLYLQTNLWLNTQGEYLQSSWRMPPPPRGPASMQIEEAVQPPAAASSMTTQSGSDFAPAQDSTMSGAKVDADYPFRHAVLLQQTRRMRSGEVNYIDHPLLSVVLKITPVDQVAPEPTTNTTAGSEPAPAP
jgi:hypothetical protein